MKAVFIVYNQAHTEKVEFMLDRLGIRGYTGMKDLIGKGSVSGDPHMGTHTWPELNSAVITVIDDEKVDLLLKGVQELDNINKDVGVRAFVWDVLQQVP
jgi:nitrogen regulatory protein PII